MIIIHQCPRRILCALIAAGFGLTVVLALAQGGTVLAKDGGAKEKPARRDAYGDPLPEGAVARLGSSRLRHPGVRLLAYSPDGKHLASADELGKVCVWHSQDGSLACEFDVKAQLRNLAFSREGKTLLLGTADQKLRWYGWPDGKDVRAPEALPGFAALSPNGVFALSYSGEQSALRSFTTGKKDAVLLRDFEQPDLDNRDFLVGDNYFALAPDGKAVACGATLGFGSVRLFELQAGKEKKRIIAKRDRVSALSFSPDSKMLAWISVDNKIHLYHRTIGREQTFAIPPESTALTFAPDGRTLAFGGPVIRFLDLATGKVRPVQGENVALVGSITMGSDGRVFTSDSRIHRWDWRTGKAIRPAFAASVRHCLCIRLSPDNKLLAGACTDGFVHVWELASGKERFRLAGHHRCPKCLAFTSDGKRLASGGEEGSVRIWDVGSGKELRRLGPEGHSVNAVAFSPDGRLLATAQHDAAVRLWDTSSGKLLHTLRGHQNDVFDIAFSPCGRWLLSAGSYDATIRLWRVIGAEEVAKLTGHSGFVTAACFTPDGRTIVSVGMDRTVRFWEVATHKEYCCLRGHRGAIRSLLVSPDGRVAITGSADTTALVWEVKASAPEMANLLPEQASLVWEDLGSTDPRRGYRAIGALVARPQQAIALITEKFRPELEATAIGRHFAGLRSTRFSARQKSLNKLRSLGRLIEPRVLQAIKDAKSVDEKRALERLVDQLRKAPVGEIELRFGRSLDILETIGSSAARQGLERLRELVKGSDTAADITRTISRLSTRAP